MYICGELVTETERRVQENKVSEKSWASKFMFPFLKKLLVFHLEFWIERHNNFYRISVFETW
jgi:hypothetical protein